MQHLGCCQGWNEELVSQKKRQPCAPCSTGLKWLGRWPGGWCQQQGCSTRCLEPAARHHTRSVGLTRLLTLSSHGSPGLLKLQEPPRILLTSLFLLAQPESVPATYKEAPDTQRLSVCAGREGAVWDSDPEQGPRGTPILLVNTKESLN